MHRDRCSCNHVPKTSLTKTGTHTKSTPSSQVKPTNVIYPRLYTNYKKGKSKREKDQAKTTSSSTLLKGMHNHSTYAEGGSKPYRSIGTSCTKVLCVTLCRHINTNSLRELHLSTDQCTTLCKLIQAHPPHTPTDPQAKYKFVHSDLNKSSLLSQVCFNSV